MKIKANQDFQGEINEKIPASFEVINQELRQIEIGDNLKEIIWQVDWKVGETYELNYQFDAPDLSPYLYLLGPLKFEKEKEQNILEEILEKVRLKENNKVVIFQEIRQWQIASDYVVSLAAVDAATVSATLSAHEDASRNVVFINDTTGYIFYVSNTATAVYRKTTNAGLNWGASVPISASGTVQNITVWYDKWTPGNTGALIHVVWTDGTASQGDVVYENINTASADAQSGQVIAFDIAVSGHTFDTDSNSITRATDGDLYVAISSSVASSTSIVRKSTNVGTNWSDTAAEGLDDTSGDYVMLTPLANDDILLMRWDISVEDVQSKEYEDVGDAWGGSWDNIDANAVDSTTYDEAWAATIDPRTYDIYISYVDNAGGNPADVRASWYNGSSWSSRTNVITDYNTITDTTISLDSLTGDVYVAYSRGVASVVAVRTFYKSSTNFTTSSTWGPEIGALTQNEAAQNAIQANIIGNHMLGLASFDDTNDDIWYGQIFDINAPSGAMLVTNFQGFESQDSVDAEFTAGTPTYSTSVYRSGAAALQTNPNASTETVTHVLSYLATGKTNTADFDVISGAIGMYIDSGAVINQPSIVIAATDGTSATTVVEFEISVNTNQTLSITNDTDVNGTYALVDNTWYVIAFWVNSDIGSSTVQIYSNDMSTLYDTIIQTGQTIADMEEIIIGPFTAGTTATIYWDDLIVDARDIAGNLPIIRANYKINVMNLEAIGTDQAWTNDWSYIEEIPNCRLYTNACSNNCRNKQYGVSQFGRHNRQAVSGQGYELKLGSNRYDIFRI